MKKKIFLCLIIAGLLVSTGFGSDERNKQTDEKEFSLVPSFLHNKQSVSTNRPNLKNIPLHLEGIGSTSGDLGLSFLKTSTSIGGEMEFFVSDRFSLALGVEFLSNSPSNVRLSAGEIDTHFFSGNSAFETRATLIPILTTLRFSVPFQKFNISIRHRAFEIRSSI